MASNAGSDALGFPVRGMPKTVREKNIIFNVIKYFEDEKERHGKQRFRPNAVMQKAAEATAWSTVTNSSKIKQREFRKQENKI